ncbi:Scr1 family TA system antitoxin-like transcriptional regulator [Streptomyces sp. NPDC056796]|uniref:DUF397 domain-containing protein n=1 Tax=Streptomyces sp. NPDC056796 TaxID=3345947 RepID=UPI0036ADF524
MFEKLCRSVRHGALLEGFPEYVGCEGRASEIRLFEIGVVPGLLQTSAYAAEPADGAVRRGAITAEQGPRGVVPVRGSRNPGGAVLNLPAATFASFVDGVRAGAFGKVRKAVHLRRVRGTAAPGAPGGPGFNSLDPGPCQRRQWRP